MFKSEAKVGKIIRLRIGNIVGRIIAVHSNHIIIDMLELRMFSSTGKLYPMPTRKIYFKTKNPIYNIVNAEIISNDYQFKLRQFKQEENVIIKNIIPDINVLEPIKK